MNVYGAQSDPNKLITTADVEIIVEASGLVADQLPKTHSPGILGSALQRAIDAITSAGQSALAAIQSVIDSAASDAAETSTQDVHDTLSGYVTDSTNAKDAAEAAATLAQNWANKTDDVVADSEYSAKYYAMRAKSSADNAATAAESAATDAAAAVAQTAASEAVEAAETQLAAYTDAASNSADAAGNALTDAENFAVSETAFTKVTDLEDETEYYSAKHYADAAAGSATSASESAGTASDKAVEAAGSATAAQNWAIKTDGAVDSGDSHF